MNKNILNIYSLRRVLQFSTAAMACTLLSGCLLTSPYWGQKFDSHTDAIPIQAWTTYTATDATVECQPVSPHYGTVYEEGWQHVTNLTPEQSGIYDPQGSKIHSLSSKIVFPENCWDSLVLADVGLTYATVIRIKQVKPKLFGSGTYEAVFSSFDKEGLECLGRWNGNKASWFGYSSYNCTNTYSGSSNNIPYIKIFAKP